MSADAPPTVAVAADVSRTPKDAGFPGVDTPRALLMLTRLAPRTACAVQLTLAPGSPTFKTLICCNREVGLPWRAWIRTPFLRIAMIGPESAITRTTGTSNLSYGAARGVVTWIASR